MNWLKKISQSTEFPLAGSVVDGRVVRQEFAPNQSSISASFYEYEILPGIREVPMSAFILDQAPLAKDSRTLDLAKQIQQSQEITPLIVAIDNDGPYILEGGHRYDALKLLNAKSFPALVVIDLDDDVDSPPGAQP